MKITVTGSSNYTIDTNNISAEFAQQHICDVLEKLKPDEVLIGLDDGIPMSAAKAVIDLKNKGHRIRLIVALTGDSYKRLPNDDVKFILSNADRIMGMLNSSKIITPLKAEVISDELILHKVNKRTLQLEGVYSDTYKSVLSAERRKFLFDNTDLVLAVWMLESGRVKADITYAESKHKYVEFVNLEYYK